MGGGVEGLDAPAFTPLGDPTPPPTQGGPTPQAQPWKPQGAPQQVAPPTQHNPQVLFSTDPNEAPQPPDPPAGYVPPMGAGAVGPGAAYLGQAEGQPFFRDDDSSNFVPEEEGEPLSPEEEVNFATLLTCGRRTKSVKILDHMVVVQSLNCDDDLRIGLYVKPYIGSLGEQRSYQVGVAAAGLRTIDGKSFVTTLFEEADQDALFQEKVDKISKMYPHVVSRIYRAVMDAEKEFVELVTRLGKLNG